MGMSLFLLLPADKVERYGLAAFRMGLAFPVFLPTE